jgi:hypothetical protein
MMQPASRKRFFVPLLSFIYLLSGSGGRASAQGGHAMTKGIPIIYSPAYNIELGGI